MSPSPSTSPTSPSTPQSTETSMSHDRIMCNSLTFSCIDVVVIVVPVVLLSVLVVAIGVCVVVICVSKVSNSRPEAVQLILLKNNIQSIKSEEDLQQLLYIIASKV